MIGAKGGCYPAIRKRIARLADTCGFRRHNDAITVASADAQLDHRLDEEVRWFYRHLEHLTGKLPTNDSDAARLREELEDDQPIQFRSSTVRAFRK